jgi:hypothetical protein
MRFMMMIKSNAKAEAGVMPDEALLTAMGAYNDELLKAGALLSGEGLKPSSTAVRVRYADHKLRVVDGPFAEAKELVAGYWLIDVKSRDEAIAWAKRIPGQEGEIEVRALFEPSDLPADPTEKADGWRKQETELRAQTAVVPIPRRPGTKRYLTMLLSDRRTESDALPEEKTLHKMGALIEDLVKTGTFLSGDGLKPSKTGARIRLDGDRRTVIDGPFTESKELIAGYFMLQTATKEEAIEVARRWLPIHVEGSGLETSEIEVRPLFEIEDFAVDAAEKDDGWRARELAFRDGAR